MADADKRPGSRDISDLKARLGLKKAPGKGKGGVVPPPGTRGGAVPPPPGVEPPRPKAADDPFGALNAAANRPAPAPEVIVIEKGGAADKIHRRGIIVRLAITAGVALLTMIVGCFMGGVAQKAKQHNQAITDAGKIADEIGTSRKSLAPYDNAFKKGYTDRKEFVDALDKIKFDPPDPKVVYESALYGQKAELVGQVMQYVAVANKLSSDIRSHIDQTRKDFDLLKKGDDNLKAATPKETENKERYSQYRYAIMLSVPTEEEATSGAKKFGATFVEIDMPICAENNQASQTYECADKPSGFRYRTDPGQAWKDGKLAAGNAAVADGQMVLMLPSTIIDVLAKTNEPTLAELRYNQRVLDLAQQTAALVQLGASLEGQLRAQADEKKSFTFFL
ncbi:MAG TPA: hypothetical protein VL172_03200 [Kofleriaceae bacterium]|nr:hypothetical protein [Kofleriaceae bacterium]